MSEPNEEIVVHLRRAYEAFNRGDFDTALEIADPDVEFVSAGGQVYAGKDAVRAWTEPDTFNEQVIEPREFRVNGDRVLIRQLSSVRGSGSGIGLELENVAVWTLNGADMATRIQSFLVTQEDAALEAAGLSE